MSDETSRDRIRSGKSWDEFCNALGAAGKTVLAPEPFGLTGAKLDRDFAPYRERYGIEREP